MFPQIKTFDPKKDVEYYSFRKKSISFNRENSVFLSIAILCMYILLNTVWYFFDLSRNFPQEKYYTVNLRIITIIAILVIVYNSLYDKYKILQNDFISQGMVIFLSVSILCVSSINSYVISANPRNNLTPILIGAIAVSALFRFSIKESLFVFLCGLTAFCSLFFIWDNSALSFALNFSAIINIYILSFIVNRRIFNSSFRYYKQLRLTESINVTLKNAMQQKDEVLTIVAHDLRGPINNIKQISEIISDKNSSEEEKENIFPYIHESCENAEAIINDLITISKIKDTADPIELACLNNIIQSVYDLTTTKNHNRTIEINLPTKKLYSSIYSEKLKRILTNLISNAIKFTPENEKIAITLYTEESYNVIEVKDFGIGVEKSKEKELFRKYSEASRKGLKGEESIGLGLYIVKELTEMMNGRISFVPNEPKGSRFIVKLPRA